MYGLNRILKIMYQTIDLLNLPNQSPLFQEYLRNANWRLEYFGYSLQNLENDFQKRIKNLEKQPFNRNLLSSQVEQYMQPFGISAKTKINLEKLKDKNCVCIVTGQQPSLFGGPIYNFYKALTAIKLATQWEAQSKIPCVPVFWNASNDHDLEEGNRFYFLDKQRRLAKTNLENMPNLPLDRVKIGSSIDAIKVKIENEMSRVDFINEAWQSFLPDSWDTIATWHTRVLNNIFKEQGLLIIEPNIFKSNSHDSFSRLLQSDEKLISQIQKNSLELKKRNYHVQVDENVSSRFMLYQKDIGRHRLQKQSGNWQLGKQKWDLPKLISENEKPEFDLSPDALGRPIWQDMTLPVAAYVAGAGEIAYYHQLKGCYEIFDMQMPLIVPRMTGSILEKNHIKFLNHYQIPLNRFYELNQWGKVPEIKTSKPQNVMPELLAEWKQYANTPTELKIFDNFKSKVEKLNRKYYGKIELSRMNTMAIGNKQLQEWKDYLFPKQQFQERAFSLLPFYARHGPKFINFLEQANYEFGKHFIYSAND